MLTRTPLKQEITQRINYHIYDGSPAAISHDKFYSIIRIEHYGDVAINFERHEFKGQHLVFLCPEEILVVDGYAHLQLITIPDSFDIIENESFVSTFANVRKIFELKETSLLKIAPLFNKLQQLVQNSDNTDEPMKVLSAILMFSPIKEQFENQEGFTLVYQFISLVHKYYKMHHEMSFYAKQMGITAKYIAEKFHVLGIMPPHEFIKNRVLIEAKRQLLYMDKTCKTICFDIGFNDPAYFSRFFKKNTGMTTRFFLEINNKGDKKKKNVQQFC
ncbi:helix-turn-helix domain-containing protein [Flagellimonas sp. S3867]|uniref:helix-turn-helix domain-containing protein n=1 Tax=Flagellimonas sp. S3867 TaxID=2768063 RepID=UPI001681E42D|nr:helix-turn-helix domain-containing protein [Flagellimonas sp. S3867]